MKKLRVMLVDDNIAFLAAEKLFLETLALVECVSSVTSAISALQAIPAFAPDLILIDLMMPGMNGIEGIREIRRLFGAQLPMLVIVLVTLQDPAAYLEAAVACGTYKVICKSELGTEIPDLIEELAHADGEWSP